MIEIKSGTLEEGIIKILQKTYPITVEDIKKKLNVAKPIIYRTLKKLQMKGIVELEPLPDKTFVRLLRFDFSFIGIKRQRKFLKHHSAKRKKTEEYDGDIYS